MAAIGKGDWVQCIDARPNSRGEDVPLRINDVYCVEEVCEGVSAQGIVHECLKLLGLDDAWADQFGIWHVQVFEIDRFKPLGGNARERTAPPVRVSEPA